MTTLTAKQEAFAQAMVSPTNDGPLAAYEAAGYSMRSPKTAQEEASRLLANPNVAARIVELRAAAAAPVVAEATMILREWFTIATADASELSRVRRYCCRHCYGLDNKYQWRNEDEYGIAVARVIDYNATKSSRAHSKPMPDCDGGFGFDRNRAPNADCGYCFGDGELDVFVADTSTLSPAARKLFAGVKTTRDGIEVKTRDQDGALTNIAKYLGMFVEKHEHSGPNGGPIPNASVVAEVDARKAGEIYAQVMTGGTKAK